MKGENNTSKENSKSREMYKTALNLLDDAQAYSDHVEYKTIAQSLTSVIKSLNEIIIKEITSSNNNLNQTE